MYRTKYGTGVNSSGETEWKAAEPLLNTVVATRGTCLRRTVAGYGAPSNRPAHESVRSSQEVVPSRYAFGSSTPAERTSPSIRHSRPKRNCSSLGKPGASAESSTRLGKRCIGSAA